MADNRRPEYKHTGVQSYAEAAERRRTETATITAHRKDAALRSKRLRRDASAASLGLSRELSKAGLGTAIVPAEAEAEGLGLPEALPVVPKDIGARVKTAVDTVNEAKPVGGMAHLVAVRALRQLLSDYEEPPYREVLSAGAVPALIAALQPPRADATALEAVFEAAWALANLAAGEHEAVRAVVPAAPVLVALLGGGSGPAVAEQAAWAVGNIAGEDVDFRRTLVANGAVRPLAVLVVGAARALHAEVAVDDGDPALAAGATAAWALSNLLRGAGPEVGEFMGVEGAPEALVQLVAAAPHDAAAEATWVVAYCTAGAEAHLGRLVHLGVVQPAVQRLVTATEEMQQEQAHGRALVIPLLRALGNIAAGGGKDALEELSRCLRSARRADATAGVSAVLACAQGAHHGLQREAAWLLASLAGAPGREGLGLLKQAGATPVLMRLLKDSPFHVRKEAAHALANICAGGGGGSGDSEALIWLFAGDRAALAAMVGLMRAPDMDAARLGLQFTEMVLRLLATGRQEIESVDGIDALEAIQFGEFPEELQRAAAALVDQYFGVG